ncbi:MAG: 8-amino-7-oxononanoate synthase [Acidobacteriota bacterium]|nr:8-amino-7-oxononanoate synthase [Blastocatellia bacterium]MDW8413624.1 8-amino-7-oxononanoate synthase [Acidobacteriota bacterium]
MNQEKLYLRTLGRLSELEKSGLRRQLRPRFGVDLCSNDYLGLSEHPLVKAAMCEAIQRLGCGATASRLLRGHFDEFSYVERRFAEFKGTEAALFFSSGYAANLGVLTTFPESGDVVFSDSLNHASIIDALRLSRATVKIYEHCNTDALAARIAETPCIGQRFLVTESLFSMDGDIAPLREYVQLCKATDTVLIVDEAHATGVFGKRGSGLLEELGVTEDCFVSINTAGKALGVMGAFVAGPQWAIDYLVQKARTLIFSTAPPPAVAVALSQAIEIVATQPKLRTELLSRASLVRSELLAIGANVPQGRSQIVPVILGKPEVALKVAGEFQARGYDVRAIRPPTVPPGTSRLRLSINLKISEGQLKDFLHAASDIMPRV